MTDRRSSIAGVKRSAADQGLTCEQRVARFSKAEHVAIALGHCRRGGFASCCRWRPAAFGQRIYATIDDMQNLPASIEHLFPPVVGGIFCLALSGESAQTVAKAIVGFVGGLRVGETGQGVERATIDVEFHEALRPGREIVVQPWRRQVGNLTSVADAHHGHIMLLVDSGAKLYAFTDPDSKLYALGSFDRAMETLLLGLDFGLPLQPDDQSLD